MKCRSFEPGCFSFNFIGAVQLHVYISICTSLNESEAVGNEGGGLKWQIFLQ